jgi:hypothetical protein
MNARNQKAEQVFAVERELVVLVSVGTPPTTQPVTAQAVRRWWLGAELNRRHKDFQSSALPTELPSQPAKTGASWVFGSLSVAFAAGDAAKLSASPWTSSRRAKRPTDTTGAAVEAASVCVRTGRATGGTTPGYASALAKFTFVSNTRGLCHKPSRKCKPVKRKDSRSWPSGSLLRAGPQPN